MVEREEMTVSGTLTVGDYKKNNSYHFKKAQTIYFFTALLVFFFIMVQVISGTRFLVFLVTLACSSIFAGIMVLFLKWFIRLRAAREYNSDQLIQNEITYTFSSKGISQKIRRSANYYEWSDIIAVYERKELFQLYVSKNKAILLPGRFFHSDQEIEDFKRMVRKKTTTKSIKYLK